uniref:tRNA (cytosine(34)-C(5))-methyltransferase n=1 Tax=Syphacia muris TaxID=451379 RepID=A0A0N5AL57_9BILA
MVKQGIRHKKKNNGPNFQKKGVRQNYVLQEIEKCNEKFCTYYKAQGIVKEDEWDGFINALRGDLPISFRIRGSAKEAEALINVMNERYLNYFKTNPDSNVSLPKPLPWYPFAFQMSMSRTAVRSCPAAKSFHNFLVTETEIGNISRQETVSMIPPLLLEIQPHHRVLDICAAPGSKTMQIIEKMHEETDLPDGIVVANDIDNTRCYLLVRQALKRLPTCNCIVINEDASCLPNLFTDEDHLKPLLFDRVLCDVMCSGDGTFRKNPELWRLWVPQKGNSLHKLQIRIARRGLQLLSVNGLMVYSTCSLNPVEDEAVVAELIRSFNGAVELVDISSKLPGLLRSPGLSTWKVFDKSMKVFNKFEEVPEKARNYFSPSFFPPADEDAKTFNLHRCCRILPHAQDTGGFFVALLKKTKEHNDNSFRARPPPYKRSKTFKEDPFVFLETDDERWKEITEHYGISNSFPYKNLLGRTADADRKRTLYFVNDAVKSFLQCNQEKVFINGGIKMFGRVEHKFQHCRFRLAQDGISTIYPFVQKRILRIDFEDMCKLLKPADGHDNVSRETLKCNENLNSFTSVICAWLGANSLAPYISKEERIHVLRMFGQDTTDMELEIWSSRQKKAVRKENIEKDSKNCSSTDGKQVAAEVVDRIDTVENVEDSSSDEIKKDGEEVVKVKGSLEGSC